MKHIRILQRLLLALMLVLMLMPHTSARAAGSMWYPSFATPRLYSEAQAQYEREAVLPDRDDIAIDIDDLSVRTNREAAQVLVVPPGSLVVGTNPHTARAYTDFGQNHAEAYSLFDYEGYSEVGPRYFDRSFNRSFAHSYWVDHWTFSGVGGGVATVALSVRFEVNITNPCLDAVCLGVGNPVLTQSGFRDLSYTVEGYVAVFDLDQLVQNVPRKIAAFDIYQNRGTQLPNPGLTPIHTNGTLSFVPATGHRYAAVGFIGLEAESGANLDASHTLSLDQVTLGQGLRLHSVAATNNGAKFNLIAATRLTISRTGGAVALSFPTATGFTYHVEYKTLLNDSPWTPLTTQAGNGGTQTVTDSSAGGLARFYRLRIE